MSVETKQLIHRFVWMGVAIIFAVAAIVFLISYIGTLSTDDPPATEPAVTEPTLPPSDVTAEDFVYEDNFLICTASDYLVGIDVSEFQLAIDWDQVKEAGVDFVMVRLGYRGYTVGGLNTDGRALENLQGARDAGLLVGAYFFSQATNVAEAEEEARYALDILGDFRLDMPLAYDWEPEERTAKTNGQTVTDCAIAFCNTVKAGGYEPMVYFSGNQGRYFLELTQLTDYPWWLAWYNTDANFYCRWKMWQYSSTGTVPGISVSVDLNVLLLDEAV